MKIKFFLGLLLATSLAFGAQQPINVGGSANDGTGDTLRSAMQKSNANFTENYADIATLFSRFPVSIANGGTGGTSAGTARSALGLAIGTNIQAWDADLDLWAGKTAPSGVVVGTTDSQTLTNKTISGASNTLSSIGNSSLTNSAITINGTSVSLGGSRSLSLASSDFANQGTATTVLHGNAAGNPSFGAVSLTADVSGDLPFANLTQIAARSVLGVTGSSTADVAAISAANDSEVLQRNGTSLVFQTPRMPTTTYASLPTCNSGVVGVQYYVTDVGLMLCDGSAWGQLTSISTTFASRGTPLFSGQTKRFTDVGYQGATLRAVGTSSSADWKVQTPMVLYSTTIDATLSASASEQVGMQTGALPAGILQAGASTEVHATYTKSGTTNTAGIKIRLGTAGTTGDTQIFTPTDMSAAQISAGINPIFKFTSTTAVTTMGRPDGLWQGVNSSSAAQTANTLSDISSSALRFSITSTTSGTTNTITFTSFKVILNPPANP